MSRIAIGSSRPSVLRSSGTSAMPQAGDLACAGLVAGIGPAVEPDRALDAAQHAEQGQHQLALALAVEPAQADDLALADREGQVGQPVAPAQAGDLEAGCRRQRCAAGLGG